MAALPAAPAGLAVLRSAVQPAAARRSAARLLWTAAAFGGARTSLAARVAGASSAWNAVAYPAWSPLATAPLLLAADGPRRAFRTSAPALKAKDPYEVLGVPRDASQADIKKAYYRVHSCAGRDVRETAVTLTWR